MSEAVRLKVGETCLVIYKKRNPNGSYCREIGSASIVSADAETVALWNHDTQRMIFRPQSCLYPNSDAASARVDELDYWAYENGDETPDEV